jgi:hypothetical protein
MVVKRHAENASVDFRHTACEAGQALAQDIIKGVKALFLMHRMGSSRALIHCLESVDFPLRSNPFNGQIMNIGSLAGMFKCDCADITIGI